MSTTLSQTADALQLDFGAEQLIVSLSAVALASGIRGRFVPTPDDIENAIAVVEDAIMLALGEAKTKPAFSATLTADAVTFSRYADTLGASSAGATVISIETVEHGPLGSDTNFISIDALQRADFHPAPSDGLNSRRRFQKPSNGGHLEAEMLENARQN
jgi:hypothetical protein